MKKILFYYQANKRSNSLETMLELLHNNGFQVIVLTICPKGNLHYELEKKGIPTYTYSIKKNNSLVFYIKHVIYLIQFIKKHNINFVHSHIQQTNFIATIANLFTSSKLLVFRHHFRTNNPYLNKQLSSKNEILFDKFINLFAPKIIVPSKNIYNGIIQTEKIKKEKLYIIPYIYNFDKYPKPTPLIVTKIQQKYPCRLRLIMVSRLIKLKQHHIVFPIIKKLVIEGYDIKLLVLSEGPEYNNLKQWILTNNMENNIFLIGFTTNFINYMSAADLLLQPSLTDASNNVVKEIALLEKIVAVPDGIGDYNEYIQHSKHGFLLSLHNTSNDLENTIITVYNNKDKFAYLGKNLKSIVLSKFGIQNAQHILQKYINLMS